MRRILAAVDGSAESLRAAALGAQIGARFGARLTLLYVVVPPSSAMDEVSVDGAQLEYGRASGEKILSQLASELRGEGPPVETRLGYGDPVRLIVEASAEEGIDLVALGSRGLGAVARALLGSVADAVAHQVTRPVLIVR